MLWFAVGLLAFLFVYAALRARKMGPLFSDEHLTEIAAGLAELKRGALAGPPEEPAALRTAMLGVAYSIALDEGVWVHHLSVSSPVTPARAAGTFFLGLVRGRLGLDAYPLEAFVTQNHVFHLVVRLSEEEQRAFVERSLEATDAEGLRAVANAGRSALLPRLQERAALPPALNRRPTSAP
jgi:hypothetical protein